MPYIRDLERRAALRLGDTAQSAGELNFQIFAYFKECYTSTMFVGEDIIRMYVRNFVGRKPGYQRYNDMVGCLILCDKEIQRRFDTCFSFLETLLEEYEEDIYMYEDEKIAENGDV